MVYVLDGKLWVGDDRLEDTLQHIKVRRIALIAHLIRPGARVFDVGLRVCRF